MPWFRIYVDKKIVKGVGGEHSRWVDVEAEDEAAAAKAVKLKANEDLNSVVPLAGDPS